MRKSGAIPQPGGGGGNQKGMSMFKPEHCLGNGLECLVVEWNPQCRPGASMVGAEQPPLTYQTHAASEGSSFPADLPRA